MGQNGHGYVGQQVKNKRSEILAGHMWIDATTERLNTAKKTKTLQNDQDRHETHASGYL